MRGHTNINGVALLFIPLLWLDQVQIEKRSLIWIISTKGKYQQNFLSPHLKEAPNQYAEVDLSQNFYIYFISWHILIRNIKFSAILDICG